MMNHTMYTMIRRSLGATVLATGVALISASPAAAQNAGPRWQAFAGCWTPAVAGQTVVDFKLAPVMCVQPTSNPNAVEIVTMSDVKVLSRDTIDASGTEHT